jgi:hypothetical protein
MAAEAVTVERKTCWIDGGLIQQAKTVAALDGVTVAEVLERNLRDNLAADFKRAFDASTKPRRKPADADLGGEAG